MKTITGAQSELIQAVLAERDVGELTAGILEEDTGRAGACLFCFKRPNNGGFQLSEERKSLAESQEIA